MYLYTKLWYTNSGFLPVITQHLPSSFTLSFFGRRKPNSKGSNDNKKKKPGQ